MLQKILPSLSEEQVTIFFEDTEYTVEKGITVTAAVLAVDGGATRTTHTGDARTPFCQIGVCFECLMEINGIPNQQACLICVQDGMRIKRQHGAPDAAPAKE